MKKGWYYGTGTFVVLYIIIKYPTSTFAEVIAIAIGFGLGLGIAMGMEEWVRKHWKHYRETMYGKD